MQPVNIDTAKTRNDIRDEIKSRVSCRDYLQRAKVGGYICPICHSGEGEHHTGAVKYYADTNTAFCHGCGRKFDVIDLIEITAGVDYSGALEIGAAAALLPYKPTESHTSNAKRTDGQKPADKKEAPQRAAELPKIEPDRRPYYKECIARLTDPKALAYLKKRGISLETARRYYIGYDPKADPAESGHPTPRIICPTTRGHYIGRSIDPNTPAAYQKLNAKGAAPGIFNDRALYRPGVVFLCEGFFDALAICEVGGEAVATNSANEAGRFIRRLEEKPPAACLILCEDHDKAGNNWAVTIRDGLERLAIPFLSADISGQAKDANEALTTDRLAFTAAVNEALRKAGETWKIETI